MNEYELIEDQKKRDGFFCYINPQSNLLRAFEDRNIAEFEETLRTGVESGKVDVNFLYGDPYDGTILDIVCGTSGSSEFVKLLVRYNANVDAVNKLTKKSPLLLAVVKSDEETACVLLADGRANANIVDNYGNTSLHTAAKLDRPQMVEKLLRHGGVQLNARNKKSQTALHLALTAKSVKSAELLLRHPSIDVDLPDYADRTCRQIVLAEFPELVPYLPTTANGTGEENLFELLYKRDFDTFLKRLRASGDVSCDNGSYTYLQLACERGYCDLVRELVDIGVNVNGTCAVNKMQPIAIAAAHGYYDAVRELVESGKVDFEGNDTLLHDVVNNMERPQVLGASDVKPDHVRCLRYLLDNVPTLNVNATDCKGNTALHYAAKANDVPTIEILLQKGAYVGQRNVCDEMALSRIHPKLFERHLDRCVQTNGKHSRDDNYEICYSYDFLLPPEKGNGKEKKYCVVSETEPLLEMSRIPELRPLLKHPVLTSFLNIKWYTIRKYFYINAALYILFWLLLTAYILAVYGVTKETNEKHSMLWLILSTLTTMLIVRELFQFFISPFKYLRSLENILEISLIIATGLILICEESYTVGHQIAAIAILLSWMELVLLIGRHPLLSTNVEMFKTVCTNFLKFLAWYSILILAFALSFYMLFRDIRAEDGLQFNDPALSIFKSIIMLTGEFDASSIPFSQIPVFSHLLFVMFVFLIAIVLFNLLNGLAVSDTQAIRTDAEIVGNVSRAKLISYIETMAISDPFPCLNFFDKLSCVCCCCRPVPNSAKRRKHIEMFYRRINLFPYILAGCKVAVLPNQENRVVIPDTQQDGETGCFDRCTTWFIDPVIVRASKDILANRIDESLSNSMLTEYGKQLKEYNIKLEHVEKTSRQMLNDMRIIKDTLNEILRKQEESDSL